MSARGFIVTGTDTGVGKTVIAAGLAASIGADYWKPVQAGLDEATDSEEVARLTSGERVTIHPEAYRLDTPCSPHEAARIDGIAIDLARLTLPETASQLVVEGAGGVLVPFREDLLAADIFAHWGLPAILVASTRLGTISHSLLSLEALRARGVPIAGIVFTGAQDSAAESAITRIGACAHLGRLPMLDPLDAGTLQGAFADNVHTELLA